MKKLTIDDYALKDLIEVARATDGDAWRVQTHPDRSGVSTIYSRRGYVIHPGLGYVNDDADARFMATFDPPMVLSLLERLAELIPEPDEAEPIEAALDPFGDDEGATYREPEPDGIQNP